MCECVCKCACPRVRDCVCVPRLAGRGGGERLAAWEGPLRPGAHGCDLGKWARGGGHLKGQPAGQGPGSRDLLGPAVFLNYTRCVGFSGGDNGASSECEPPSPWLRGPTVENAQDTLCSDSHRSPTVCPSCDFSLRTTSVFFPSLMNRILDLKLVQPAGMTLTLA